MPLGIFGKLSGPPGLARRRGGVPGFVDASGGFVTPLTVGSNYYVFHVFDNDSTDNFVVTQGGTIDAVLIGGGGGSRDAGFYAAAGGGAGAVNVQTGISVTPQTYTIIAGGPGPGGRYNDSNLASGGNTSAFGFTANGGSPVIVNTSATSGHRGGTSGDGFAGGSGANSGTNTYDAGGGGGGATGAGGSGYLASASSNDNGIPGAGYDLSTFIGTGVTLETRSGGDIPTNYIVSEGGKGGRYNGTHTSGFGNGADAAYNLYNVNGPAGREGAVIVKYQVAAPTTGRFEGNTSLDQSNSTYTNSTTPGVFGNAVYFNRPSGNTAVNRARISLGKNWLNDSQFNTESNAFTIEFRVKYKTDGRAAMLMTTNGGMTWNSSIATNEIQLTFDNGILELYVDGSTGGSWGNQSAAENTWHAIAICSDGNGTVRGYLNGSLKKTWTNSSMSGSIGSTLTFGLGFRAESLLNGHYAAFDEMRFSNIARYTGSTYTLATQPFTNDSNTTGLYHLNDLNFTDDTGE